MKECFDQVPPWASCCDSAQGCSHRGKTPRRLPPQPHEAIMVTGNRHREWTPLPFSYIKPAAPLAN